MSASTMPTSRPRARSASARLTVSDDLPTPPLPDATAITRVRSSTAICRSPSRRPPRSCAQRGALLLVHVREPDRRPPRRPHGADVHLHLRLDVRLERAARDREPDRDVHVPAVDVDRVDHAELHDVAPQLGVDDLRKRAWSASEAGLRHDGMLPRMSGEPLRADAEQRRRPAPARSSRAATTRERPTRSSGAALERARASGSATAAPASRTISWAAAMSTARAPRGRRLATASTRPSARWQSASASEPSTRTRSACPSWRRRRREVLGPRRLEGDELRAARAAATRRARRRRPSRPPRGGDPLLAVAEVVDVAEARHRPSPGRRPPRPRGA